MPIRLFSSGNSITSEPQPAVILNIGHSQKGIDLLVELIGTLRPTKREESDSTGIRFQALLYRLQADKTLLFSLRKVLLRHFLESNITGALTESGLLSSRGFIQELTSKIKHKFLPPLLSPDDFLYVVEQVFYRKNDYKWMEAIERDLWVRFFELVGIQINLTDPGLIRQLSFSLQVLSYRLSMMGFEKEVARKYHSRDSVVFPFLEQNRLTNLLLERSHTPVEGTEVSKILIALTESLHNCLQSIRWLKQQRAVNGTSLAETFLFTRMEQHVERMFMVIDALDRDHHFDTKRFVHYLITVVRNQNRKNSILEFLSQNLGILAYQIAEHVGKRGEPFITEHRKDFYALFRSALGGGFIISFIAVFKNLLGRLMFPPFLQGLLYSANYSVGFIMIQSTGSTLATKQPAFTASAVAASLDSNKQKGRPDLYNLAVTVSRVSRSQIASFAGNLLVVFPLTWLLAVFFHQMTGHKVASGDAALAMMHNQHPFQTPALIYACFTGVFLFLSGLIAGWVENYVVYARLADRIKQHPVLKYHVPLRLKHKIYKVVEHKLGLLAGSISLGFFLGMSAVAEKLFYLPFDIRHITISAGNAAIGFYGLDHQVSTGYVMMILFGVLMIGFFNFLISFGLAFFVAVKSRGIRLREYPEFMGILWNFFKQHPADFIRPPKKERISDFKN